MESPVQCECYAHAAPGFFSLAGTAVKASGTGARRPVDVCFVRTGVERRCVARCRRQRSMGICEFPQQAENRFRVTKPLLAN